MDSLDNTLFQIPIYSRSKKKLLELIAKRVTEQNKKEPLIIFTPNPEQLSLSLQDEEFKAILQRSDINIPDGQGIVWALRRKGVTTERMPGRILFHELLTQALEQRWSVFLLGGSEG